MKKKTQLSTVVNGARTLSANLFVRQNKSKLQLWSTLSKNRRVKQAIENLKGHLNQNNSKNLIELLWEGVDGCVRLKDKNWNENNSFI